MTCCCPVSGVPTAAVSAAATYRGANAAPTDLTGAYATDRAAESTAAAAGAVPDWEASVRSKAVATAVKELGNREKSKNDSSRIREYRSATAGALNTPGPWCSYFTSWVLKQAGVPIGPGGKGFGAVDDAKNWAKSNGKLFDSPAKPKPGDLALLRPEGGGNYAHIGMVEKVDADGTVHTIEGNADDSVKRKSYPPGGVKQYIRAV